MDALAALAEAGAAEGTVLLADEQTAGRGRHGRTWHTPPGVALALSVLFRPELPPERLPQVPMAVALAALDVLGPRVPEPAALGLKWPNDVVVSSTGASAIAAGSDGPPQAKIAGLLSEVAWEARPDGGSATSPGGSTATASRVSPRVIVGLGLNVRQPADALPAGATSVAALWAGAGAEAGTGAPPEDATDRATPLAGSPGHALDRTALAIDLLRALDTRYAALRDGGDLVAAWSARLVTLGRAVVAHPVEAGGASGEPIHGRAVGVTASGALRLDTASGEVVVHARDVTLRGEEARR